MAEDDALVTGRDLEMWFGGNTPGWDQERGQFCVTQAIRACRSVVNPVPQDASMVVLSVAARIYSNPGFVAQQLLGPVQATPMAPTLTRAEIAQLRRFAGTAGAFSIETLPSAVAEMQSVVITGSPTGGTWRLATDYGTTSSLIALAAVSDVQAALQSLYGQDGVSVSGAIGNYVVTWPLDRGRVRVMSASWSFTDGQSPGVTVTELQIGSLAPPGIQPWWDRNWLQ